MTNANDGAFAASDSYTGDGNVKQFGLTKREYFAAMAMQGLLSCNFTGSIESFANKSVQCADALITELNKEQ